MVSPLWLGGWSQCRRQFFRPPEPPHAQQLKRCVRCQAVEICENPLKSTANKSTAKKQKLKAYNFALLKMLSHLVVKEEGQGQRGKKKEVVRLCENPAAGPDNRPPFHGRSVFSSLKYP